MAHVFACLEAEALPASVLGYLLWDICLTVSDDGDEAALEQLIDMLTARHKHFHSPQFELGMCPVLGSGVWKSNPQAMVEVITPNFLLV